MIDFLKLTVSAELIVEFIRKNVHGGNLSNFFHERGPYSSAVFKHIQPQSQELRPLDEAAQVIEESAPVEIPEDPWEHLYAYLEWFARWTQRVMPNAVWKEAMQQSKKTLLPCS